MENLQAIHERRIQRAVRRALSDPSRVYATVDGRRLQILAPGRINVHEGPDFLDMAILLGSDVIVGSAEFHRKDSDWHLHGHEQNVLYTSVILHIVSEADVHSTLTTPTVVLTDDEIRPYLAMSDIESTEVYVEDIHTYSLLRLLRKTAEHKEMLQERTALQTFLRSSERFLQRYLRKRRRPAYTEALIVPVLQQLELSAHARFISSLEQGVTTGVYDSLTRLIQLPIATEGAHLRRELLVNALLPCALAVARDAARVNIFEWYWSVDSLNDYGVLHRVFHNAPQQYLWQQQGMLEMLRDRHADSSAHETLQTYGLIQTLHFYTLALESEEASDEFFRRT